MTTTVGQAVGDLLLEKGREFGDTYLIVADGKLNGTEPFIETYPQRFLNVGIAEQNAISVAAGLASAGKQVYLWNCSTFLLYRPFDQVRVDAAFAKTRLRLIGTSSGLSRSASGIAHLAIEDLAIMRALPNMTVLCPGDLAETRQLLAQAHEVDGPVYVRFALENHALPEIHAPGTKIQLGKAITVTDGGDAALIATGNMLPVARDWVDRFAESGLRVRLVSMPSIKPFDAAAVAELVAEGLPIITLEDHSVIGGLGTAVAEAIAETGRGVPFRRVGVPDEYPYIVGTPDYLHGHFNIPGVPELRDWLEAVRGAGRVPTTVAAT
ncbi:transketolase C-terminal domain-containing protein [Crossiella sp. CA-258035]|uniref:transketolase family protein n=1 Tax=Crossiella sp. CA-258035 TaxID=2981138 RepID=UPI0024BBFD23|nr:transketolase C-terminal domain-containing protein [Crossiella sp. CA-258035]WHT16353.1 transketolase C-terminal domain-containing protein [Crossiella sp. CA-258035]